jgi:predicted acylesterase/phospholipase RssA
MADHPTTLFSGSDSDTARIAKRSARKRALRSQLAVANDYGEWTRVAQALDDVSGRSRWKRREASALYDHAHVRKRLDTLRELRKARDARGLVFAIEEGIHGNLGGMGKPILYNKARFGTKQLITDYVEEVADALLYLGSLPESELPHPVKIDLMQRASHCYGRSALLLSAGGTLMYFHFGVVKAMLQNKVLPGILSGSSAGAFVCAVVGTRTDEELRGFLTPENVRFSEAWQPTRLERITGLRPMYKADSFDVAFERLIPDLTFREAYEHSGRHISISVSPCERHHSPRLLNAITSPHVLIRSAVRASCAVPGVFEPVQLLARNAHGRTVPYLDSKWVDGLFAADLPARQLARLYGVNHTIVSIINPLLLPIFRDHKLQRSLAKPVLDMLKDLARHGLKSVDVMLGKYLPASSLGVANKLVHDILAQRYTGDVSIVPSDRLVSPLKLLSPFTLDEIGALMLDGERQTWPRIEMLRTCTRIGRVLDEILHEAGEDHYG